MNDVGEIKSFLLDMDGTINLGSQLLPGAKEFIDYLKQSSREFLFLTNNSSKDRSYYQRKMSKLGIECTEDHFLTSGDATISYLEMKKPGARVFLLGTRELEKDFWLNGFIITEEEPEFVVLGFDMTLTYEKLVKACKFIRNGVEYISTHPDLNCPMEDGYIPDAGSIMALIEASTGIVPQVIGKPNQEIIKCAFQKLKFHDRAKVAIVGDRVYTDIKTGQNAGITSILVLSGESGIEDLKKYGIEASFVFDGVSDLYHSLKEYDLNKIKIRECEHDLG
jgi:4-nitrophenyl phosphatase